MHSTGEARFVSCSGPFWLSVACTGLGFVKPVIAVKGQQHLLLSGFWCKLLQQGLCEIHLCKQRHSSPPSDRLHALCPCLQPVLPSSGTGEWLIKLTTSPDATPSAESAQSSPSRGQPTAGVLVDTLKALNPGVQLFKYPDAKSPGCFKERPPYTNWSQVRHTAASVCA